MKWYGILALLFIISALGGIVYLGANTDKITFGFGEPSYISKQIESAFEYDCAKTWDDYRDIYYENWDPTLSINYLKNENLNVRIMMIEKEELLFENGCFITVKDWAFKSKYQDEVWDGWEIRAENNKAMLNGD